MNRDETCRVGGLSTVALFLLLYAGSASAQRERPAWKDPLAFKNLDLTAALSLVSEFHAHVHEYIVCQRGSLQKRAAGLAPAQVRELVLRDREIEERAIAEALRLDSCLFYARHESDPAIVHSKCEERIQGVLEERHPPESPYYKAVEVEQRNEFGGIWSFRALDLGRPGQCDDAECDNLLAVEVTNTTPVALKCEVALLISNGRDGARRGEQAIKLYPGDSLPAAPVRIRNAPERVEPQVSCSPVAAIPPADLGVPAACVLLWQPRPVDYPRGFSRSEWQSGAALIEFTAQKRYQTPTESRVVDADSSTIGAAARAAIEKLSFSTNCDGQRFRIRVEYRAFPCFGCSLEGGVVTLLRDDRLVR